MAFFENLWNFLKELQPLRIVRTYEQGIRFTNGIHSDKPLPAGVYAVIPFFDDIEKVNIQEDTIDLPMQSITTKDGRPITMSWTVEFQVVDAVLHFMSVRDFDENIVRKASRHIASKVRDWTMEELLEAQSELESGLKGTLQTATKDWGVKILKVGLTDLVQAKPYRLIGGLM